MSKCKQIIIIRRDLKMRRGKEIAQGCHASMKFLQEIAFNGEAVTPDVKEWFDNGTKKVCVTVESLEDLVWLHEKARLLGLRSHLITDEGLTEFNGVHTITCLAIGPNFSDAVDEVTKNLPLY